MKRWHCRWLFAGGLAASMIFIFAAGSPAQLFRLGEWKGVYETVTEYQRRDTKTGSSRSATQDVLSENRLSLRNVGASIYDPRLITLSLGGTFGLSQEWLRTDGDSASHQGRLWGYDFFTSILPEKAFSLNLFANRNQSLLSGGLVGRTEVQTENRGATLFARRLYIPSTLTFRQELRDEESRSNSTIARRRDRRNVLTYQGVRGWIDSEMDLRYEFVDYSDEVFSDLSYQSHEGNLYYSLDFGPELNRRWDSRLRSFTRTGLTELTTLNVDELLRIDHTERLRSDFRYSFLRTETLGGATTTHTGAASLRHRLYESLTTTLGLDGTIQTLQGGEKNTYRGRLDFAYTKRLPGKGRLTGGLGGTFQYEDNRFDVTETFLPQESHTAATPFALSIALRNPFVILSSVVVTKVAVGPLPIGCIVPPGPPTPLVLGRDFTLRTVADITNIVPIPCAGTTPGINPGDTIAVDYRVRVSSSLTFATATWHFNLSADYRWIRPYFLHEQTDQMLLSGRDGRFLDDRRSDTIGTELRYDKQRLRASLVGEAQRFTSQRLSFDTLRSRQFLSFNILPDLTLTLNSEQAFTDFTNPERQQTQTLTGRATVTYAPNPNLFTEAFAGIRHLSDTLAPNERITKAGVRVRWFFRRVEISPTLEFIDWRRGNTDAKDYRVGLHIIRRF